MKLVTYKNRYECFPLTAGVWMDVMKAVQIVKLRPRKPIRVSVEKLYKFIRSQQVGVKTAKKDHPKGWTLQRTPILMAPVFGIRCTFDGWHRILHAHRKRQKTIGAYLLTEREAKLCAKPSEKFKRVK